MAARPTPKKSTLAGRSVVAPSTPSPSTDTMTQQRPAADPPKPAQQKPEPEAKSNPGPEKKPAQEETSTKPTASKSTTPAAEKPEPTASTSTSTKRQGTKGSTPTPPAGTVRAGIYFGGDEFEAAKASYLADWENGGEEDTFTRWIAAAIIAHARRSPKKRAELARPKSQVVNGVQRTFNLPEDSVRRMREAIVEDGKAGRWTSDSAWCADAITIAVHEARERNGGTLPTPPARLPNRLKR